MDKGIHSLAERAETAEKDNGLFFRLSRKQKKISAISACPVAPRETTGTGLQMVLG
jgi:hypothetical protein